MMQSFDLFVRCRETFDLGKFVFTVGTSDLHKFFLR